MEILKLVWPYGGFASTKFSQLLRIKFTKNVQQMAIH